MSVAIINLRQARKHKKRHDREQAAKENRRKFGRSKAESEAARKRRKTLEKQVEAHRIASSDERPGMLGKQGARSLRGNPEPVHADRTATGRRQVEEDEAVKKGVSRH